MLIRNWRWAAANPPVAMVGTDSRAVRPFGAPGVRAIPKCYAQVREAASAAWARTFRVLKNSWL